MQCFIDGCPQLVLNTKEQTKQYPLCFYHAKVRDGLIDPEDTLSSKDMNWKNRDAIAIKYKGYPYKIAYQMIKQHGDQFELKDLTNVGNAALYEAVQKEDATSSYVYKSIQGRILNHIQENAKAGITGVSHKEFWKIIKGTNKIARQKNLDDAEFLSHFIDSMDKDSQERPMHELVGSDRPDPEQYLIGKEEHANLQKAVVQFFETLGQREKIVFQQRMLAKKPTSTRALGERMRLSRQTIANLQQRVIKKARRYFIC